jgi:hypothetical protein
MNRDLQSRIANAFGDYADLIVRKAGEKQRGEGLGGNSGSSSLRSPEPVPVSALTGNDPGRNQEHREPAQPNKRAGSNS